MLIKILSQTQEVCFSEACDLILSIGILACEHAVNGEPNLCLNLSYLVDLIFWDLGPLLVLELLDFDPLVPTEPWFQLNEWDKNTWHIVNLSHLMHNLN